MTPVVGRGWAYRSATSHRELNLHSRALLQRERQGEFRAPRPNLRKVSGPTAVGEHDCPPIRPSMVTFRDGHGCCRCSNKLWRVLVLFPCTSATQITLMTRFYRDLTFPEKSRQSSKPSGPSDTRSIRRRRTGMRDQQLAWDHQPLPRNRAATRKTRLLVE